MVPVIITVLIPARPHTRTASSPRPRRVDHAGQPRKPGRLHAFPVQAPGAPCGRSWTRCRGPGGVASICSLTSRMSASPRRSVPRRGRPGGRACRARGRFRGALDAGEKRPVPIPVEVVMRFRSEENGNSRTRGHAASAPFFSMPALDARTISAPSVVSPITSFRRSGCSCTACPTVSPTTGLCPRPGRSSRLRAGIPPRDRSRCR